MVVRMLYALVLVRLGYLVIPIDPSGSSWLVVMMLAFLDLVEGALDFWTIEMALPWVSSVTRYPPNLRIIGLIRLTGWFVFMVPTWRNI